MIEKVLELAEKNNVTSISFDLLKILNQKGQPDWKKTSLAYLQSFHAFVKEKSSGRNINIIRIMSTSRLFHAASKNQMKEITKKNR